MAKYLNIDDVIIIDYSEITKSSDNDNATIAVNTVNTWQEGRSQEEKQADTDMGKLAEDAVITFFDDIGIIAYFSYDSFRRDGFQLHAPFDGVITERLTENIIVLIDGGVQASMGTKLNAGIRAQLRGMRIFTVEVKSTQINTTKRADFSDYSNVESVRQLIARIRRDDFFTYPFCTRTGDMTFLQYCELAKTRLGFETTGDALKAQVVQNELDTASDLFIRVYMDKVNKKALIMGWVDRHILLETPTLKKFIQWGKSEHALYLSCPMTKGRPITALKKYIEKKRL